MTVIGINVVGASDALVLRSNLANTGTRNSLDDVYPDESSILWAEYYPWSCRFPWPLLVHHECVLVDKGSRCRA